MRTTTMSDALHGSLVDKLRQERKEVDNAIALIERNMTSDWKGVPTESRRTQEERLPKLRWRETRLTEWIDALATATQN